MSTKMKKLLILNLPYVIAGMLATNIWEAWRLAEGADTSAKLFSFFCVTVKINPLLCRGRTDL